MMKLNRQKPHRSAKGVSSVITTVILTGILLTILLVATFVSMNILGAQLVSTEFNQAQTNMLLLDSTIEDVSLRQGAGGFIQFNEREGGIGLKKTADTITVSSGAQQPVVFSNLLTLVYSGGTSAIAAVDSTVNYSALKGSRTNQYVTASEGLGYLELTQDNGAKIKLDYNRVRVVSSGIIDSKGTNLIQVTFLHLKQGPIDANPSGQVSVIVQNQGSESNVWTFENTAAITMTIQHATDQATWQSPAVSGATRTVVVFNEVSLEVSIK